MLSRGCLGLSGSLGGLSEAVRHCCPRLSELAAALSGAVRGPSRAAPPPRCVLRAVLKGQRLRVSSRLR
eukprot:1366296-Alexandrium_andersonii.AAC.1